MFNVPSYWAFKTASSSVPVTTPATGIGYSYFTANWNAYTGAVYYLLDVSLSSSFSSFVLENQVVDSTSFQVTGLLENTTYYYRVRAVTSFDADATSFFARILAAGGSINGTEQAAADWLVVQLKAYGLWSKMVGFYPIIGATANSCKINLISANYTGTFGGGFTFSSYGAKGSVGSIFDTNANTQSVLNVNNCHFSFYQQEDVTNSSTTIFGNYDNFGTFLPIVQCYPYFINNLLIDIGDFAQRVQTPNPLPNKGFVIGTRTSSTLVKSYRNGVLQGQNTGLNPQTNLPNVDLAFWGVNANGTAGNEYPLFGASASFGLGLNDTQAADLYTIVQQFQTTLNRQV
jgi:hypothetical protein